MATTSTIPTRARKARSSLPLLPALAFLAALLLLNADAVSASCTGCTKPSFGPNGLPFPANPIAIGDFNGDGLPDVVSLTSAGYTSVTISISIGTGGGLFSPGGSAQLVAYSLSAATGDFDGDGRLDLLVARQTGGDVLLYRGDGAGGLEAPLEVASGFTPGALAVGDFDGDGNLDFAVGGPSSIFVFHGLGGGAFAPPAGIPLDGDVISLAAKDLDGDGLPDLIAVGAFNGSNGFSVYLNRGPEGFQKGFSFSSGPSGDSYRGMVLADLNGDGHPDLVAPEWYHLVVHYGLGDGTFGPAVEIPAPGASSLVAGDVDGDGRDDVIVFLQNSTSRIQVFLSDAFGVPQPKAVLPGDGAPLIADFDGDGKLDVATLGVLYLGNGDGTFVLPRTFSTATAYSLSVVDLDANGKPDIAWYDQTGRIGTMIGDGAGGFSQPIYTQLVNTYYTYYYSSVFADVTGDGRVDAVVAGTGTLNVYPGIGDGTFGPAIVTPLPGSAESTPVVADFDGDHIADVALVVSGQLLIFPGDGSGRFLVSKASNLPANSSTLYLTDLNGDGKPDLVLGGGYYGLTPLLNDGHGRFTAGNAVSQGYYGPVAFADVDGDGKADLLTIAGSAIIFQKGDGLGGFGTPVASPADFPSGLFVYDLDGDGKPDILAGYPTSTFLKGNGDGTFVPVEKIEMPGGLPAVAADLNMDGKPDLVGTANGLTWLLMNTTCESQQLRIDVASPSCGSAGAPLPAQPVLRVVDDAGSPVLCATGSVQASLVAGPGTAHLTGTTAAPVAGGVARFTDLGVDLPGDGFRIAFTLPGARSAATQPFSQSPPPPVIAGPSQICAAMTAQFDGGVGADAWTWSLDGTTIGTERILTLPPQAPGAHALALTVRKDACVSSTSVPLSVLAALPTPTATSNGPIPFGGTLQLRALTVPGASYVWSGPNGFASTTQNPSLPYATEAASGRYTVTAVVGTCRSASSSVDAVVLPGPCRTCPNPSFYPAARALPVPASLVSIAVGDFDGDGLPDIVGVQSDYYYSTVLFLRGNGRGGFAAPVLSPVGFTNTLPLVTGDLDGNGLLDLVALGTNGVEVSLQTAAGTNAAPGTFGGKSVYATGFSPTAAAVADVNGDGSPDLVVANGGSNTVSVLLGNGTGMFGDVRELPVGLNPSALLLRDVDGDSKLDLIVANRDSGTVSVFRGAGDGTFSTLTTLVVPGNPVALAMADVSGDPTPDLVVGYKSGNDSLVAIYQGSPSGAFTFVRSFPATFSTQLALADLDGDGRADLITLASDGIRVWRGQGSAVFSGPDFYPLGTGQYQYTPVPFAIADIDGDGRPDLVSAAGSRVLILAGDGDGKLSQPSKLPVPGSLSNAGTAAWDVNSDGIADLQILNSLLGTVEVYLSDGHGGFSLSASLKAPGYGSFDTFAAGDVDGDGLVDIVGVDSGTAHFFVFRGRGDGSFESPVDTAFGASFTLLGSGDVDGDGRMDLVLRQPGLGTGVVFGKAGSTFGPIVALPGTVYAASALVAKLNRDGARAVIITDQFSENVSVFPWNGVAFSTPIQTTVGSSTQALALGDFDGDGLPDLVVSASGSMHFLPGNGAGGFGPARSFGPKTTALSSLAVDVNGDGFLDVAATCPNTGTVAIFIGDGHGNFSDPTEFATGVATGPLAAGDFHRTGRQDLAVAASGSVLVFANTNCVPKRLGVTADPACTLPGQPFEADIAIFDDGLNVVACESSSVSASLVPGAGTPGAVLSGTLNTALTAGAARFSDLQVDRAGRRFVLQFQHPFASAARSAPFSVGAVTPPAVTGPALLCAGSSVYAAPAGYDTYAWTLDGVPLSYGRTVSPSYLSQGSHVLAVTATRDRCAAGASVTISNAPPSLSSITPAQGVSQGGTTVTATAACVAPAATLSLGGSPVNANFPSGPASIHGSTTMHLPGAVDAVLANPDGQTMTVPAAFQYVCDTRAPAVSTNSPVCAGQTLTLQVPVLASETCDWTGPGGFIASGCNISVPNMTLASAGTYSVTVHAPGCTLPLATTSVVINATPSAAITAPSSVGASSAGNTASVPDAGPAVSYSWYISGGTMTSTQSGPTVTFQAGIQGTVTLSVYVTKGTCTSYSSRSIPIVSSGTQFYTVTPCRLFDTRLPNGPSGGPAIYAGYVRNFPVSGHCGIPAGALAVTVNTTVTGATSAGDLAVYAGNTPAPPTTNLSFKAGQTRAESSFVMLGSDGSVNVMSTQPYGETANVILDVSGYFK